MARGAAARRPGRLVVRPKRVRAAPGPPSPPVSPVGTLHRTTRSVGDDAPRTRRGTGLRRPGVRLPRGGPGSGPRTHRHGAGGARWHQPGPLRARGHLGRRGRPPGPPRDGRCRPRVRPHRPGGRRRGRWDDRRRPLLHRPCRRLGRRPGARGRGLACPGGGGLLQGDGPHADGTRASAPLREPRPGAPGHRGRTVRGRRAVPGRRRPTRRGGPDRRPRDGAHRATGRHRRHDPGRAGPRDPGADARRAGRSGRPRHRQDRGGVAPGRLPAVHEPVPPRGTGGAGCRPEPALPGLHRAGAAVPRRGRHRTGDAVRRGRRRPCRRPPRRRVGVPAEGRPAHGQVRGPGGPDPPAVAAPRPAGRLRRSVAADHRRGDGADRGRGASPLPHPQCGPPLCRAGVLLDAGRECPRRPRSGRRPGAPARRAAGPRGTGVDVAGPDAGATAERPVRVACAAAGCRLVAHRRRRRVVVPTAGRRRRQHPLVGLRRPVAGRGPGGTGAAAGPSGAGRRPHLRPHRRGRGPGPLTDGTAHARAAVPEWFDDRGGRHRPGHGRLGPRRLGEHPRPPARQASLAAARADRGLPHPRSAHGPRRPGAGRGCPRPHAAGGGSG